MEGRREFIHITGRGGEQEKRTNENQTSRNAEKHVNKIQVKLSNTGKDRICATINHIHYIMKEGLDFCKYYATENIN